MSFLHHHALQAKPSVQPLEPLRPWQQRRPKHVHRKGKYLHTCQATAWQPSGRLTTGFWDGNQADPVNYHDERVSVYNQARSANAQPSVWEDPRSQWSENRTQGAEEPPFQHLLSVAGSIGRVLAGTSTWITDVVLHLCPPGTQRLMVDLVVKFMGGLCLYTTVRSMLPVLVPFMGILVVATFSSAAISLSTSSPTPAQPDRRAHRGQRINIQYQQHQAYQGRPGTPGSFGTPVPPSAYAPPATPIAKPGSRPLSAGPNAQPRIRRRTQVRRIVERGAPGNWQQRRGGDVSDVWYGSSS